jgi:Sulfotransferase family
METSSAETIALQSLSAAELERSVASSAGERKTRPVFVMGCHRSGTNLLYDTLLSAGGFAVYRGYLPVYKMLIPRFGNFADRNNRQKAAKAWVRSQGFRRSGLDADRLIGKVVEECRSGGDFIRLVMNDIAFSQNAARWAVYDPDNLLHIPSIKADIPEALFVHIIRDGRDVALSLRQMGGFKPFPWNRQGKGLLPTALYWEWMVRNGRRHGLRIPGDYLEVRYEELVLEPQATLRMLADFLDHDLDYGRISESRLGSLRKSNSSFSDEADRLRPVNRWKEKLSEPEVESVEGLIGEYLEELGYPLSLPQNTQAGLRNKCMRASYFNLLNTKLWLKTRTPLGRLASLQPLGLSDSLESAEAE